MTRLFLLVALLLAGTAEAATDLTNPDDTYLDLLTLVKARAASWNAALRTYADWLFWSLASIQFVWTMGPLVMRSASFSEIATEFMYYVVRTGFFYSVLVYSQVWGQNIVDAFRLIGGQAAGQDHMLQPGKVFELAVEFANTVSSVSTGNPIEGIGIMFASLMILIGFTYIATLMGVILLMSYVVVNAGILFLGFGGAQFSRQYAHSIISANISIGAQLFVLTLIVGIITSSARDWQAAYTANNTSTLVLVGLAFMSAIFTQKMMDMVQSLIMGTGPSSGSVLGSMAVAGMAFGGAAATALSAKIASMGSGIGAGGGIASAIKQSLMGGGSGGGGSSGSSFSSPGASSPPPFSPSGGSSPSKGSGGMGSGSAGPGGKTAFAKKAAGTAHAATAGTGRTIGLVSALTVPGMEPAANMSLGPSPLSPDLGGSTSEPPPAPSDTNNSIEPDDEGDKK